MNGNNKIESGKWNEIGEPVSLVRPTILIDEVRWNNGHFEYLHVSPMNHRKCWEAWGTDIVQRNATEPEG